MQTSSTDPAPILLAFAGEGAAPGRWLLIEGGRVAARGEEGDEVLLQPGTRTALAVPGAEVTIHWLDLAEGLAPAQAAAAARLMLADASADSLADMHVAVGLPERDLTPVALAPAALMAAWIARDPDIIVPTSLLLLAARGGAGPARRGPRRPRLSRRRRRVQRRARDRRTSWSARRRPRRSTRRRSRPASPPLCRRPPSICARAPSPAAGSGGSMDRACAGSPGWRSRSPLCR